MDINELIRRFEDITNKDSDCLHPGFKERICISCGLEAKDDNTFASYIYNTCIPFKYINKDLRYSKGEIARLKDQNTKNMLRQRKLHLVIDLESCKMVNNTFSHTFFSNASRMFDMYVYTMCSRTGANEMARLLDYRGDYFASRVVSREDCTQDDMKSLDVILGKENATLILDGSKRKWPDHNKNNLIPLKIYRPLTTNKTWMEIVKMENDEELRNVFEILKIVHTRFFEEYDQMTNSEIDVRNILQTILGFYGLSIET